MSDKGTYLVDCRRVLVPQCRVQHCFVNLVIPLSCYENIESYLLEASFAIA